MNMSTLITCLIVATGLCLAVRHVYRNFRDGKHDCCGCTSDACHCHEDVSQPAEACPHCSKTPIGVHHSK